jgi:redox-sensitive bicupin YhaK (pirin superfamily)
MTSAAMSAIARLQRTNRGSNFRAYGLHGDEAAELIDPFLGVDHAWISAPTFPPHPHAGFSAVSYLFLDSGFDASAGKAQVKTRRFGGELSATVPTISTIAASS